MLVLVMDLRSSPAPVDRHHCSQMTRLFSLYASTGEHESSRRLKTEILTQMEGVATGGADRRVLLVAATNRPEASPYFLGLSLLSLGFMGW